MESGLEEFTVNRLKGKDRFGTNLAILEEAGVGSKPILVCTGLGFADSLSASAAGLPILLVWKDLTPGQKDFLNSVAGNNLYVIGGTGAVSEHMEEQLAQYGTVRRLAGGSRFDTSVMIAEEFFDAPEAAVLAYAWDFPDGLCGGSLAYAMKAPLILTMTDYESQAAGYIQSGNVGHGVVLGGEKLISDDAVRTIFEMEENDKILVK
jgi:putative cell wall-binding protein